MNSTHDKQPDKGHAPGPSQPSGLGGASLITKFRLQPTADARNKRLVSLMTWVAIAALVLYILVVGRHSTSYTWDFGVIYTVLPVIGSAIWMTVGLTAISLMLSLISGVIVALALLSPSGPLRGVANVFVEVIRNTPLLVQLVWIFYALPILLGIQFSGFTASIITLTANTTAYMADAFRAGIQSVPKAQVEAAGVLGLKRAAILRYVILPHTVRNVLPVLAFLSVLLFKNTSLVAWIGVNDIMGISNSLALSTFRPLEILTTAGVIYFVIALPATMLSRWLERRMAQRGRL
ncbi:MAG: amino acid ABC transporter permease [Alcaligenaceae bacterium]|nr:amino acid ABC transporter permease [Alcaligenaceae bacterium]